MKTPRLIAIWNILYVILLTKKKSGFPCLLSRSLKNPLEETLDKDYLGFYKKNIVSLPTADKANSR